MKKIREPDGHEHVELSVNEARQGSRGTRIFVILVSSVAGAVAVATLIGWVFV